MNQCCGCLKIEWFHEVYNLAKGLIVSWLIVLWLFPLFIFSLAPFSFAATREATWTEFRGEEVPEEPRPLLPEKAPALAAKAKISGNIALGYQSVRDVVGKENKGLSGDWRIDLRRESPSGLLLLARVNGKKTALTTGSDQAFDGNFKLGSTRWQVNLAGDLGKKANIVDSLKYESESSRVKGDLTIRLTEALSMGLEYSRATNTNSREDSTTAKSETDNFKAILRGDFGRLRADLDASLLKTSDPLNHVTTKTRGIGVSCTTDVTGFLNLNFGARPERSETEAADSTRKVSSDGLSYWSGLGIVLSEKTRFTGVLTLSKVDYEKPDTSFNVTTLTQDYRFVTSFSQAFSLNLGASLSKTKNASKTQTLSGNFGFQPRKKGLLGRTSVGVQANRVEDRSGNPRSKNITTNLSNTLNFGKNIEVSTNFGYSKADNYSSGTDPVTTKTSNFGIRLSQRAKGGFDYSISYGLNKQDVEGSTGSQTNSYGGNATYRIKLGFREIPLSLNQTFTQSDFGNQETKALETRFSTEVPIVKSLALTYAYNFKRGERAIPGSKSKNRTTENIAGMKLAIRAFSMNLGYTVTEPKDNKRIETINGSASYSLLKQLSLAAQYLSTQKSKGDSRTNNATLALRWTF